MMLGNVKIEEMQSRLGVEFPEKLVAFMEASHQAQANNIAPGKWHCFDMPFTLVCGDMETATTIHNHLKDLSGFKTTLQISLQNN
jgi:hypothetical protein